jgi:hypothetical protein
LWIILLGKGSRHVIQSPQLLRVQGTGSPYTTFEATR